MFALAKLKFNCFQVSSTRVYLSFWPQQFCARATQFGRASLSLTSGPIDRRNLDVAAAAQLERARNLVIIYYSRLRNTSGGSCGRRGRGRHLGSGCWRGGCARSERASERQQVSCASAQRQTNRKGANRRRCVGCAVPPAEVGRRRRRQARDSNQAGRRAQRPPPHGTQRKRSLTWRRVRRDAQLFVCALCLPGWPYQLRQTSRGRRNTHTNISVSPSTRNCHRKTTTLRGGQAQLLQTAAAARN